MDDNVWEYPFGDLEDDEDMFYRKPAPYIFLVQLRLPEDKHDIMSAEAE
jgi:hypothetical protein